MKSLTKSLIVATIVGAVGTGTVATGAIASAESGTTTTGSDPMSTLVDKIASTFNLDKTKVQEVFDEQRTEMEEKRETEIKSRLQALVDDKTITAEQKTAIETKLKEMKSERESNKDEFKNMTSEERKSAMEKKKTGLETWAKENGIDLTKLAGIFGGPGGGHRP